MISKGKLVNHRTEKNEAPRDKDEQCMCNPNQRWEAFGHQTKNIKEIFCPTGKKGPPDTLAEVFLRSTNSLCSDVLLSKQMFDYFA